MVNKRPRLLPLLALTTQIYADQYQECFFRHALSLHEKQQLNRIQPIMHHTFELDNIDDGKFNYFLQICHDFNYDQLKMPKDRSKIQTAYDQKNILGAGLIQIEPHDNHKIRVLGRLNDTRVRGGNNWVRLEFREGDKYSGICNNQMRTAELMITCNPKAGKFGKVSIIHEEERDGSNAECYYLLQMESNVVCNVTAGSSWFVVLLKVLFFSFVAYILIGFLYNKFVNKNSEVPHSSWFKQQGNRAADLCDKFFRSNQEGRRYDGIINDPDDRPGLGNSEPAQVVDQQPEVNEDDHLLPM